MQGGVAATDINDARVEKARNPHRRPLSFFGLQLRMKRNDAVVNPFLKVNLFARVESIQEEFPELLLSTRSRVNINNGDAKRMARGTAAQVHRCNMYSRSIHIANTGVLWLLMCFANIARFSYFIYLPETFSCYFCDSLRSNKP